MLRLYLEVNMSRLNNLWIEFGGVKSNALGLKIIKMPDRTGAAVRGTSVSVLGRSGDLFVSDHSLGSITMQCVMRMLPAADRSLIANWLTGSAHLVLSDDPDFYIKARVSEDINFARAVINGSVMDVVTVTFNAEPFKYSFDGAQPLETITEVGSITNPGNDSSLPVITIYGSGNINLMIGGFTLLLSDVNEYITIDTDAKIAFKDDANHSSKVTLVDDDDMWPELLPGENLISWAGNVTSISIIPHWRWR